MNDSYLAVFARRNGHAFHAVGQELVELYAGVPIDEVSWMGESWIRVSDLRDGVCDYVPKTALA